MRVEKAEIRELQPEHMITTFSKVSEELGLKNTDSKVLRPSTTRRWIARMFPAWLLGDSEGGEEEVFVSPDFNAWML